MTQTPSTHPVQLRLPGQLAAPDGPVDMSAMYLVHHAFRRDLARFRSAVAATPVEERRTWRRLARRWEVFAHALEEHHRNEDAHIWPFLEKRVDPAELHVLVAMEEEHAQIDPMLEACREGFRVMAGGGTAAHRSSLHAAVTRAQQRLDQHLGHEESEAIALIQRTMTAADWSRLEEELRSGSRLRDVLTAVPWALQGVPDDARERVFGGPGGRAFRVLWVLTRRRFARRERRAFRHG